MIKSKKKLISLIAIVSIAFFLVLILKPNNGNENNNNEISNSVKFPYSIEGLDIISSFDFTGMNVDDDNNDCQSVASIEVKNNTSKLLQEATITITNDDGKIFEFVINYLPSDSSLFAFDINSTDYTENEDIKIDIDLTYVDSFDYSSFLEISTFESGEITIKNISNQSLENIVIQYKCLFEDTYFGGVSYPIEISKLEKNETFIFNDTNCYMGKADIVFVSIGN